jgi:outer membrane protein OmpA-like peptidoglycan-associated protein
MLAVAVALCLALGGCAGDEEKAAQSSDSSAAAESESFPNLASVPDEAPPSTPRLEREKLIEGLQADRANAEYTGEILGEETANVAPAAPPPPAPPAAEEEPAIEGDADDDSDSPAASESEAAAAAAAPETAALPVDFGEPKALIYFAGGAADLTDHDRAILNDVATMYAGVRGSRVRVIGHASPSELAGAGDGEPVLAMARADAVAKTLIALGVPEDLIETTAGGAMYDESQPNGVAANRRVEVYIGS